MDNVGGYQLNHVDYRSIYAGFGIFVTQLRFPCCLTKSINFVPIKHSQEVNISCAPNHSVCAYGKPPDQAIRHHQLSKRVIYFQHGAQQHRKPPSLSPVDHLISRNT